MLSTHAAFKKLVSKGMGEELAEVVTEIMEEKQNNLVTKSDLVAEMAEVKSDIKWLKNIGLVIIGLLIKVAFFN